MQSNKLIQKYLMEQEWHFVRYNEFHRVLWVFFFTYKVRRTISYAQYDVSHIMWPTSWAIIYRKNDIICTLQKSTAKIFIIWFFLSQMFIFNKGFIQHSSNFGSNGRNSGNKKTMARIIGWFLIWCFRSFLHRKIILNLHWDKQTYIELFILIIRVKLFHSKSIRWPWKYVLEHCELA